LFVPSDSSAESERGSNSQVSLQEEGQGHLLWPQNAQKGNVCIVVVFAIKSVVVAAILIKID
jgi:hypothetical protein